jgi:hypothetical protein
MPVKQAPTLSKAGAYWSKNKSQNFHLSIRLSFDIYPSPRVMRTMGRRNGARLTSVGKSGRSSGPATSTKTRMDGFSAASCNNGSNLGKGNASLLSVGQETQCGNL